jgi:hypothetical protein
MSAEAGAGAGAGGPVPGASGAGTGGGTGPAASGAAASGAAGGVAPGTAPGTGGPRPYPEPAWRHASARPPRDPRQPRAPREPGGHPALTRGTARPEGGGRAAAGDAPAPARQWPILLVIAGAVVGLVVTATGAFRGGLITVGAALLVGALVRWAVTNVGMLAVRSRFTDVITYGVLGAVIVLLALMAQPDPVIRIPFLEDIIHFSVR